MSSGAGLNATRAATSLGTPALWLTGAERWLLLAGLSVALGGLAGRGLARQYLARDDTPAAPARLPPPWALRGSLAGLVASAALLVTVLAAPGAAATLARPPAAGLGGRGTAVIAAAELACFALAALLLRLRRPGWSVAPLSGVVLAEGLRAHPEGMIPVAGALLTYCHLLPAVLWAGMLVYTARTAIAWRAGPAAARGLFRLYGTAAAWLFGIVVVTGVLSAVLLVPVSSLLTTTYGRFLVAKAALVAAAAALALASRARLRRPAPPGTGLPLAVRLEIAALAAVLAATGLLTVLTPPAKPVFSSAAAPALRTSGRDVGVGQVEVGQPGREVALHAQRLRVVPLEHRDPQGQGQERVRAQLEQGDVVVHRQRIALLLGERQPRAGLTGDAVEDLVRLPGFPPGDRARRVGAVPLHQLRVTVDGEQELVDQVLAHSPAPAGYQVK
ncbi:MAG: CopD family protein [Streptosporangiaceae bacterium]